MGTTQFQMSRRGASFDEAYKKAYSDAQEEHGHEQGYSGTINSCERPDDITAEFKSSKLNYKDFINKKLSRMDKRECSGICIEAPVENKNKVKSIVKHTVTPGTKKWVLKYVVRKQWSFDENGYVDSALTKGEAVKKARAYTEKTQKATRISMEKVLEKGSDIVAEIEYKKSPGQKDGLYIFFGQAPD